MIRNIDLSRSAYVKIFARDDIRFLQVCYGKVWRKRVKKGVKKSKKHFTEKRFFDTIFETLGQ